MILSLSLPSPLVLLIIGLFGTSEINAQGNNGNGNQQITLNQIQTYTVSSTTASLSLAIPSTTEPVWLSIEMCSQVDGASIPQFFAKASAAGANTSSSNSRSSASASSTSSAGNTSGDNGEEVILDGGVGIWSSDVLSTGGTLLVRPSNARTGSWTFRVGLSTNNALSSTSESSSPLLGDTTSTTALLFSPPFLATPFVEPIFPNYTLPSANLAAPTTPNNAPNNTIIIVPSAKLVDPQGSALSNLTLSSCYLASLSIVSNAAGTPTTPGAPGTTATATVSTSLALRDQSRGWRTQFLVEGLTPSTEYTMYTVATSSQGGVPILSQPASFKTKSASFACTLVHSLPFCPSVSWAAPFPPLDGGGGNAATTYTADNFPAPLLETFINSLSNFSASLLTFPCGRDLYSVVQNCSSCERAYRQWLCSVLIPRCGESGSNPGENDPKIPPPALVDRSIGSANITANSPRIDQAAFSTNGNGNGVTNYQELLPCLETCHAVDRSCPPSLQWVCPRQGINAERSYGVGYIDQQGEEISGGGREGAGLTGASQDTDGNVWCNGFN